MKRILTLLLALALLLTCAAADEWRLLSDKDSYGTG